MDIIKDWIIGNFGVSALVLLGLIALGVYVGAWIASLKKDIRNLPCGDHRQELDRQRARQESESSLLHNIEGRLDSISRIETSIESVNRSLQMLAAGIPPHSSLTQSHSPISLSDKGNEIAEALELKKMIGNNWDRISEAITEEKNPYDIQMKFISEMILHSDEYLDSESIEKIKNDAFGRGLPLAEYLRMIGILARDRYFSEHGIDISEVDI